MVKLVTKALYDGLVLRPKGPKRLVNEDPKNRFNRGFLSWARGSRWAGVLNVKASGFNRSMFGLSPWKQDNRQNSIAKVSYLKNQYKKQWKAHGRYLARQGAQRADERGLGFNQTEDAVNIAQTLEIWQDAGDPRLWKMIISPEMGDQLDLKEHVRSVMAKVEVDLNARLEWVAIDHYNTDQHHVHMVIRGVRQDGQELRIEKGYLKNGFREHSREEATRVLGLRQKQDILDRRQKMIDRNYVTEIDREIVKKIDADSQIRLDIKHGDYYKTRQEQIQERLKFLEEKGLVERLDAKTWQVDKDLLEHLKAVQINNDIIKTVHKQAEHIKNPDLPTVFNGLSNVGDKVLGRVVDMGVNELNEDARYILVEGVDKQLHYIVASSSLIKKWDSHEFHRGDVIFLERCEMQKQGPVAINPWMFTKVGLNGEEVTQKLLKAGVIYRNTDKELFFEQRIESVQKEIGELFPATSLKVQEALRQAQTIRFIHMTGSTDFDGLRQHTGIHDVDRYLVDMIKQGKVMPERKPDDPVVRAEFMDIVQDRALVLRHYGIMDLEHNLDLEQYEYRLKQKPMHKRTLEGPPIT